MRNFRPPRKQSRISKNFHTLNFTAEIFTPLKYFAKFFAPLKINSNRVLKKTRPIKTMRILTHNAINHNVNIFYPLCSYRKFPSLDFLRFQGWTADISRWGSTFVLVQDSITVSIYLKFKFIFSNFCLGFKAHNCLKYHGFW